MSYPVNDKICPVCGGEQSLMSGHWSGHHDSDGWIEPYWYQHQDHECIRNLAQQLNLLRVQVDKLESALRPPESPRLDILQVRLK